ncbi:MAG: methyltransferase domain-containing protein [Oscillospiraceae bacterium]|nr:methyltransferase domain-containing protein [Oscillospiraceae bacterium]
MIRWNEESIRLMVDSLEYTGFAARQCEHLAPYLPADATVMEAGSGIGYLSYAMSRRVKKVVSVEYDPTASAYLQKWVKEEGIGNIRAVNADAFTFDPEEEIHTLVCCRFGSMEEILSIARHVGAKQVLVLTLANKRHRVSAQGAGEEAAEYCRPCVLTEQGIEYSEEHFTVHNGQPFRTVEDAVQFFRMYDKKGAGVTAQTAAAALIPDPKGIYQWYYPMESEFRLLRFEL